MKRLRARLAGLHADHRRIARGAMRVAFFVLLGKFAGAAKEMAVAYRYGVSDVVDAYQFTMTMASWLPVTLVGALAFVLVPALVRLREQSPAGQTRFLGELQGVVLALGLALAALTWLLWPWVLQWGAGGLTEAVRQMSRDLLWAFAPAALLTLLTGLSAARLRARERHFNTLLESVPALVILVWLMAADDASVAPLLWGTLAGYIIQCAWQLKLAARADGVWGRPRLSLASPEWKGMWAAAGVLVAGQVIMSFAGPIDQYSAAQLGQNANATLGYATRLIALALGVGAMSVGRAALPVLAGIQSQGDQARLRAMTMKWTALMLCVGVAAAALAWLLAPWAVALLFERGAFSAQDTAQVSHVLRWGLLQLPFYFAVLVLMQSLASQGRFRVMALIAAVSFAVKAALNLWLAPVMGVSGIMLATVAMYALSFAGHAWAAWRLHEEQGACA
jgi:peptidoglycan biosynthesis protein MviN/MurJ (putative lipid II flippase)